VHEPQLTNLRKLAPERVANRLRMTIDKDRQLHDPTYYPPDCRASRPQGPSMMMFLIAAAAWAALAAPLGALVGVCIRTAQQRELSRLPFPPAALRAAFDD
jgi:hypothetical protein